VYHVAFTDYLKAPNIKSIDAALYQGAIGEKIEIKAVDDFKVTSVHVELRSANDVALESGEAVQDVLNPMNWIYTVTTANQNLAGTKIVAKAKDKPGNITIQERVV
jgi:hypothetical protein